MNWRVIVRMSFYKDPTSSLRNRVAKHLAACGLKSSGTTGTWEGKAVSAKAAAEQFAKMLNLLSDPSQIGVRRAQMDQLWLFIDRAKIPKVKSI